MKVSHEPGASQVLQLPATGAGRISSGITNTVPYQPRSLAVRNAPSSWRFLNPLSTAPLPRVSHARYACMCLPRPAPIYLSQWVKYREKCLLG